MRRVDGLVLHNERDLRGEQQRMTDDHRVRTSRGNQRYNDTVYVMYCI